MWFVLASSFMSCRGMPLFLSRSSSACLCLSLHRPCPGLPFPPQHVMANTTFFVFATFRALFRGIALAFRVCPAPLLSWACLDWPRLFLSCHVTTLPVSHPVTACPCPFRALACPWHGLSLESPRFRPFVQVTFVSLPALALPVMRVCIGMLSLPGLAWHWHCATCSLPMRMHLSPSPSVLCMFLLLESSVPVFL